MLDQKLEVILLLDHRQYTEVLEIDGWVGQTDKADIIDHTSRALCETFGFNCYYSKAIRYNIFILDDIKSIIFSCIQFKRSYDVTDYDVRITTDSKYIIIKINPIFKEKK